MSTRYATIITNDDGQEVVSSVGQFAGGAPQIRTGKVEQVADGVLIGMVRGGPVDSVDGFGFPDGAPGAAGRAIGIVKANEASERNAKAAKAGTKSAADVLAMANSNFMSFKSAAKKLLGDETPENKADIVAALEDLATKLQ
ncbi:MAG: hypothetical protein EOS46_27810 [Mesorhizobium sp.]|uniref:hypothetical protein n=1 Tax=Mesorhizobium sp. TaxID=1871066 RepID=UPI000FEAAC48|nr:hypothetical protein [Mesorhizobium sp.]RWF41602.1 MAG: hypothetical protein EOS46_27810 [Mesorhizobium sp.]